MPNQGPRVYRSQKSPDDLQNMGPLIAVTVSLPDAVQQLRGADQEENVEALIDTGASHTNISNVLATKLGLTSINRIPCMGVSGLTECNQYSVNFTFTGSGLPIFRNWLVNEFTDAGQGFQVLIGRDFLRYTVMVYDGTTGRIGMEIPGTTDLFSKPPFEQAPQLNREQRRAQKFGRR